METLFSNIYILSLYGFIIYTYLNFVFTKDKYDDANKKFNYKKYLSSNWDNWLLSLLLVPVIAFYANDIWGGLMDWQEKDWQFRKVYYLGVGALVEFVYWIFNKVSRKKNG